MKRMISPELFQIRGSSIYDENIREFINNSKSDSVNSETSLRKEISHKETWDNTVFEEADSYNDKEIRTDIRQSRGSIGSISNHSTRRQGTTIPPKLDELNNKETSMGKREELCDCGCTHAEENVRRRSTGNSPVSYEEKHHYVGDGNEPLEVGNYSARHGKYSLVYDDNYVLEALQCCRHRMRRNALCDPFRMPMPQKTRERLERENERRKASVTRKVSQFLTVRLDLNREEDLL